MRSDVCTAPVAGLLAAILICGAASAAPASRDTKRGTTGRIAADGVGAGSVRAGVEAWSRGDYAVAIADWRPLAVAGDADAEFDLGQAYKLGKGVPVDMSAAEDWYRKAALQGHLEAEDNYGLMLFQNTRRVEALPWLEKSAARGEPRAQLVLGTMLYNGDNIARDWPRAYALIVRAAAAGLPQASPVQAQMDQYIPADDRQKGLVLARQYEADAQHPQLPSGRGEQSAVEIRTAALPPSAPSREQSEPLRPTPAVVPRVRPLKPVSASVERGFRVQLGAFRDNVNARRLWQTLDTRVAALRALQPVFLRSGGVTRLQAGPIASAADALRVCSAVRPTGTACVPIAP